MVVVVIMVMVVMVLMGMRMVMVVIVIMGMIMAVCIRWFLFGAVHRDPQMGACDPAFYGRLCGNFHPGQADGIHSVDKALPVSCQLQQRCCQHVPCGAHAAFQVQCFVHEDSSLCLFRSANPGDMLMHELHSKSSILLSKSRIRSVFTLQRNRFVP